MAWGEEPKSSRNNESPKLPERRIPAPKCAFGKRIGFLFGVLMAGFVATSLHCPKGKREQEDLLRISLKKAGISAHFFLMLHSHYYGKLAIFLQTPCSITYLRYLSDHEGSVHHQGFSIPLLLLEVRVVIFYHDHKLSNKLTGILTPA